MRWGRNVPLENCTGKKAQEKRQNKKNILPKISAVLLVLTRRSRLQPN